MIHKKIYNKIKSIFKKTDKMQSNLCSDISSSDDSSFDTIHHKNDDNIIKKVDIKGQFNDLDNISPDYDEKNAKIKDVYIGNKFNKFLEYCQKESIKYMYQLEDFDFTKLLHVRGIGIGKFEDIKNTYSRYLHDLELEKPRAESKEKAVDIVTEKYKKTNNKVRFENINKELVGIDINFLAGFSVKEKTINRFEINGYKAIGDLGNIDEKELRKIVDDRKFNEFIRLEKTFEKTFLEAFEEVIKEVMMNKDFEIFEKRIQGKTLHELGEEYNVTRERIRQKNLKLVKKLDVFMELLLEKHFIIKKATSIEEIFHPQKNYVYVSELMDLYENNTYGKIIVQWCKMNKEMVFLDFAQTFVKTNRKREIIERELLSAAENFIAEGIEWDEKSAELENIMEEKGYPYMNKVALMNFLSGHGYKKYKNFVAKGKQSYGYLCSRIVAEKFPKGIKIYEGKELDLLREYVYKEYGDLGIPEGNRAFSARLSDFLVLSGRGKAIAQSNVRVDETLLDILSGYIENSSKREVYYSEIFTKYEKEIRKMSNIDNYNFLHGVLKMYFAGDYDFSNRDYLSKRGDGLASHNNSSRIKSYIEKKNEPIHIKELKEKVIGFTSDIVITSAVLKDDELIQWDYSKYYSISLMDISKEDEKYLENQINEIMKKYSGYCSDNLLFDEVRKFRKTFLEKNNIESPINLHYTCKKILNSKFDFRRPHIVEKGLIENISFKTIIPHFMKREDRELLSFKKYQELCKKLKWSSVTTSMIFAKAEVDYIRITQDLYLKKESFKIDENQLKQIEKTIRSLMTQAGKENGVLEYLSMVNVNVPKELPEIGYEWNEFLLRKIIEIYIPSLKVIDADYADRRYERGIVFDGREKVENYEDIVVRVLKGENCKEISEKDMLEVLIKNNLAHKIIPKSLYTAKQIKFNRGWFEVL